MSDRMGQEASGGLINHLSVQGSGVSNDISRGCFLLLWQLWREITEYKDENTGEIKKRGGY